MKNRLLPTHWLSLVFLTLSLLIAAVTAYAQQPATDTAAVKAPAWPDDSLGRRSPRGTVEGFLNAVAKENYVRAARYLSLDSTRTTTPDSVGIERARALQRLLDSQGNIIPRTLISSDSTGQVNDNLGPDLDLVGTGEVNGESFDILVERVTGPAGGPLWLFSSQTVKRVPALTQKPEGFSVNQLLPAFLIDNKWGGVPVGHWLAMLLLAAVSYVLAGAILALVVRVLRTVWAKARAEQTAQVIRAFVLPIQIYLTVLLFVVGGQLIGVSIIVRQSFSEITVIMGLVAFLLLLWRLIDVFSGYAKNWLLETGQPGRLSAVLFLRRGIKLILIAFGAIAILNVFGWDVTTGLAALGIGGIALALGAQKTIENFVGSITIIADQPLRVGDFCSVDGTSGTVEQIGMRSTRLRTADRTIVVIPNGQLAALKIENFAFRDRLLFNPTLQLRYETTPDQIRYLLVELRNLLKKHPKVNPVPARVRFVGMAENSLDVEIFSYIDTLNYDEFLEIKEDLTLNMMDIIAESGTGIAFPSQTLYMGKDNTMSEEKTRQAEEKGRALREQSEPSH